MHRCRLTSWVFLYFLLGTSFITNAQRERTDRLGNFLECLKRGDPKPRPNGDDDAILRDLLRRCLEVHQNKCFNPARLQMVEAHPWGFGSAMNLWIQSLANAVDIGLVMLPVGPFSYADPQVCPPPSRDNLPFSTAEQSDAGVKSTGLNMSSPAALRFPGPECYFQRITGCNESSRPIIRAKAFAKQGLARGKNMLYKASRLLHVSPGWVWGNFASYLMEPVEGWVRNELLRRSDPDALGFTGGRKRVGLHMRLGSANAPIIDGRKRPKLTIDDFMRSVDELTEKEQNLDIYIITDQPELTTNTLTERYRGDSLRSTHRFLVPKRNVADLGYFHEVDTGAVKGSLLPMKGFVAQHSVADISLDLLADIEVLSKHVDFFIGSHSNLFFLVYGLRMQNKTRDRARHSCWVNTEMPTAPLNCPSGKSVAFRRSYDVAGILSLPLGPGGSF